jgi:hypothetical protein
VTSAKIIFETIWNFNELLKKKFLWKGNIESPAKLPGMYVVYSIISSNVISPKASK